MLNRRHFLLAAPLAVLAGCSRKAAEEPLWVGHVVPLSGTERSAGEHAREGILLAVEEANEKKDGRERRLAVLHADSRGQIEQARHEAVRLVTLNKIVALLGGRDQATADALGQALQAYPVSLVTPAAQAAEGLEGVFSLDVAPEFRGVCLARFAGDRFKVKKAVLVVDPGLPCCDRVARAFDREWRKVSSSRSAETWDLSTGDKPTVPLADRLEKSGAELLLFAGKAAALTLPAKLSLPVLFGGEEAEWRRVEKQTDVPGNLHAATVHAVDKFDEEGQAFLKRYRESRHEEADADAWNGYEMMRVVTAALRDSKATGALGLREKLTRGGDFPGLTGKFSFREGRAVRPVYIVKARGSSPELEYPPDKS